MLDDALFYTYFIIKAKPGLSDIWGMEIVFFGEMIGMSYIITLL